MHQNVNLAIVCPMANERLTAVRFVDDVLNVCLQQGFASVTFYAILDRVSHDGTVDALRMHEASRSQLKVIWAPENRNVVDAYVRGYREALAHRADWILEIDAGYSHLPAEIPQFFSKMPNGYDCVFGSRFVVGGDMTRNALSRRIISRGGTVLTNLLLNTKLNDMTSGFQLFTREAMALILKRGIVSTGPFFQTEMKAYTSGLKTAEVPITYSGANHRISSGAILDSFKGLFRLFGLRLRGQL